MDALSSSGLIALISALFTGVGLKVIEWILKRGERNFEYGVRIREEMREELEYHRSESKLAYAEVDAWKDKYYKLLNTNIQQKEELLNAQINNEILEAELQNRGVDSAYIDNILGENEEKGET